MPHCNYPECPKKAEFILYGIPAPVNSVYETCYEHLTSFAQGMHEANLAQRSEQR